MSYLRREYKHALRKFAQDTAWDLYQFQAPMSDLNQALGEYREVWKDSEDGEEPGRAMQRLGSVMQAIQDAGTKGVDYARARWEDTVYAPKWEAQVFLDMLKRETDQFRALTKKIKDKPWWKAIV